jgi:hypothetical protein
VRKAIKMISDRYIKKVLEYMEYIENLNYHGIKVYNRREMLRKLGRTFRDIAFGTAGASILLSNFGCNTPTSPELPEPEEPEEPEDPIIYEEKPGIKIMRDACEDNGLITSDQIPPASEMIIAVLYNGKMVDFRPDFVIEKFGNPYHAFGEYLSSTDGFTEEQDDATDYFNAVMVNADNGGKGAIIKVRAGQEASKTYQDTVTKLRSHYLID